MGESNVSAFEYAIYVGHNFLPRSKHLLISWLQSPSAVILEPRKKKAATVSTVSPSVCHEVIGPDAMILIFLQFVVIHTVKGFVIVSKEEMDVFLELSCFSDDPADLGNLSLLNHSAK